MKKINYRKIKRGMDVLLSSVGIVLLTPVFFVLAIMIKKESKGPVFFRQKRVGIHKMEFDILKFRTMKINTPKDVPTHMLANSEKYITRTGQFLRKTSLDELPQLINIWKGEMSIIGPRPALWNQYDLIAERDRYGANDVTPGLTGFAQIHGRDELEIPLKARMDGYYVKHMCFLLDLKCFVGTLVTVVKAEGIVEGGTGRSNERRR